MFSAFETLVALRYLRSRKAEGFVSVIAAFSFTGIMLGVATLIIVMSVMNGFREELFSRILGLNGHMSVYSLQGPLYDYDYIKTKIQTIDGIEDINPIVQSQALISVSGVSNGVMVRGMRWEDFSNRPLLRDSITAGKLEDFTGNTVAVGSVLAEKMKLTPGDKIVITSPQVKSTPFGSMPRQRSYTVSLIFDVEMYEYNSGFVFMPIEAAQVFFQMEGGVSALELFLKKPDQLPEVRKAVSLQVEGQAGVYDWRDMN